MEQTQENEQTRIPVTVGQIFSCSWGYEQTNVDFYQVTKVYPSGKSCRIREIVSSMPDGETGYMTGHVIPVPGSFVGDAPDMLKKIRYWGSVPCLTIASYAHATPWDGKPERVSWYG